MSNTLEVIEDTTGRAPTIAAAEPSREDHRARRLTAVFWLAAIVLGLLHAWAGRYIVSPDGVSYLDMGEAYLRGDWAMAVNAYWSPLYAWLLGLALLIIRPSPYWEFATAHLVNFMIYLGALACFAFFLRELVRLHRARTGRLSGGGWMSLPGWAWLMLGYTLFIWSSLELITLRDVSPDMCVAALVYLAMGIIVRIRRGAAGWPTFICLGAVLGLGYLAKAAMFPLTFVFLAVGLFAVGDLRRAAPRTAAALVIFALVGGPFIAALSRAKGRLTFGDSGKLNYAWYVSGIAYRHWQGDPPGSGTPLHPTRKISDAPEIYEFGSPIGGTYPPWYDPSYWCEGLTPHFALIRHIKTTLWRPNLYSFVLSALRGGLAVGLFILYYMSGRRSLVAKDVAEYWFLLLPALAAFAMYMQVRLETRFIGAFLVLLFTGLFCGVRLADRRESRRLLACVMTIIVAAFTLTVGPPSARAVGAAARDLIKGEGTAPHVYWQVAEGLRRMGVRPGDKAASLRYSNQANVYWARLAKVQIVAEIYSGTLRTDENDFWAADPSVRGRVIEAFTSAGADIIVANDVPPWAAGEGWRRVGNTGHHVYFLPRGRTHS